MLGRPILAPGMPKLIGSIASTYDNMSAVARHIPQQLSFKILLCVIKITPFKVNNNACSFAGTTYYKSTDCYALTRFRNPDQTSYTYVSLVAAAFVRSLSKLRFLPHCSRISSNPGYRPSCRTGQVAKYISILMCKHIVCLCIRQHFYSKLYQFKHTIFKQYNEKSTLFFD